MSRQETDTIYRQETTKHLKHRLYEAATNNPDIAGVFSEIADNRVETWIEELPSAQQRWIPVAERLPERDGEYLVTIPNFRGDHIVTIRGYSSNLYALDRYAFRRGEAGWYEYDSEYGFIGMNDFQSPKTLAWMPLPEPYKGGEK